MKRAITIVLAYLFAATVGVVALTVGTALYAFVLGEGFAASDVYWIIYFSLLLSLSLGWIVALPVAVFSEIQLRFASQWVWDWKVYTAAGFVLGLGLLLFFTSTEFQVWPIVLPATTLAGFAYWVFAWRWLPPTPSSTQQPNYKTGVQ